MAQAIGTEGDDIILPGETSPGVVGAPTGLADSLFGLGGDDRLDGDDGADTLAGGSGSDTLLPGDGDTALGEDGSDLFLIRGDMATGMLDGGPGLDILSLGIGVALGAAVALDSIEILALGGGCTSLTAAQLAGFATLRAAGGATEATLLITTPGYAGPGLAVEGLARLVLAATDGADAVRLSSDATALDVDAGGGDDLVVTGSGDDTLRGGDGDDTLDGGGFGHDRLLGGAGDDLLLLDSGDDADGGAGDDVFYGYGHLQAAATLEGGAGTDIFRAANARSIGDAVSLRGIEVLAIDFTGFSISAAQLGAFSSIRGDDGATTALLTLAGGGQAALLLEAALRRLDVVGSGAAETLAFTAGSATQVMLRAGAGDDDIASGRGLDRLAGGAGDDSLAGGAGDDTLRGGPGEDLLVGGAGADRLIGDAGADRFRFLRPDGQPDRIADFEQGVDRIEIDARGFGGGLVGGAALTPEQLLLAPGPAATAPAGMGQFLFDTRTAALHWDADGAGGAASVAIARLPGVAALTVADILLLG